ncbi:hypothetical protein FQN49_006094 [Arthroderma sp. PD_2]|nr:hypothetical protein FQN49_006094 [Arthroderma sp. PD_2]
MIQTQTTRAVRNSFSSPQFRTFTKPTTPYVQLFCRALTSQKSEDLINYTSGRYLFNEDLRLKERHVEFDIDALKEAATRHIGLQHGKVERISKLAEGGFNRVFLLTAENGFQAATLEFLRLKGVPAPKLYGYSVSHENPVGVEYILMEKGNGVGVETKWNTMTKRQRHALASSYVNIEKRLFAIHFRSSGSIYFKKDIPAELQASLYADGHGKDEASARFCIGPIADYMFWYGKRAELDQYRGPWRNPNDYLQAIAGKEIEWTRRYGKMMDLDFPHNGLVKGKQDPQKYISLLQRYQTLASSLLPKDKSSPLNQPTLRHPDLNPNNILVSPDTCAVSCIIDWQHTVIEPRLLAAGYPPAFENPETDEPRGVEEPQLPSDYVTLSSEEKAEADELYRRQLLSHYYHIFNGAFNKSHLHALQDPLINPRKHLVDRAGRQWTGNLMTLSGAIARMLEYWPLLPDTKDIVCPVKLEPSELKELEANETMWFGLNTLMNHWREKIGGISEDGWVASNRYDEAVKKTKELKDSLVAAAEGDEEDLDCCIKAGLFEITRRKTEAPRLDCMCSEQILRSTNKTRGAANFLR